MRLSPVSVIAFTGQCYRTYSNYCTTSRGTQKAKEKAGLAQQFAHRCCVPFLGSLTVPTFGFDSAHGCHCYDDRRVLLDAPVHFPLGERNASRVRPNHNLSRRQRAFGDLHRLRGGDQDAQVSGNAAIGRGYNSTAQAYNVHL